MRRLALVITTAALLLGACADVDHIDDQAARALDERVQAVRAATESGDRRGALQELAGLRQALSQAVEDGEVGEARAEEIRTAAASVEARLVLLTDESASPPPEEEPAEEAATPEPSTQEPAVTSGGGSGSDKQSGPKKDGGGKDKPRGQGRGRG